MRRWRESGITCGSLDGRAVLVFAELEMVTGTGARGAVRVSSSGGGLCAISIVPGIPDNSDVSST